MNSSSVLVSSRVVFLDLYYFSVNHWPFWFEAGFWSIRFAAVWVGAGQHWRLGGIWRWGCNFLGYGELRCWRTNQVYLWWWRGPAGGFSEEREVHICNIWEWRSQNIAGCRCSVPGRGRAQLSGVSALQRSQCPGGLSKSLLASAAEMWHRK